MLCFFADKPIKTKIEVPEKAYVGEKLVINCYSEGLPVPNYTITHNVTTNILSNQSRYIKDKVDYSDAGIYECVAKNVLGSDKHSGNLTVKGKILLLTHFLWLSLIQICTILHVYRTPLKSLHI